MQQPAGVTRSLVCIAASQDVPLLTEWEHHVAPLRQANILSLWSEQAIQPGEDRQQVFLAHLDQAHVIVVLVSADLLASEECLSYIEYALQRAHKEAATVFPLLVRSSSWSESTLGTLPCLPANALPIDLWGNKDEAWHTCVVELQRHLGLAPAPRPLMSQGKPDHSDRGKLLRMLRQAYQEDLDTSLEHLAWLELGLHKRSEAVYKAPRLFHRRPDQSEEALPIGTSILDIYDEAVEALLILGEPGSGKSTLLKMLGLDLLTRAESDLEQPLPILFPLSSWAEGKPLLADWLVEQLADRYRVPRHLGTMWIKQKRILPLLDGLDEMAETARAQCIVAINSYRLSTFSSLVVCSRTTEYQLASVRHRLALQQAVVVQPLTQERVLQTVRQGGTALTALSKALDEQEELRELARTPLMLSILMLTYSEATLPMPFQSSMSLEKQVWDHYLERMLREKGADRTPRGEAVAKRYDPKQTRSWLGWLAYQMRRHNQTVFSGEYLRESWLPASQLQGARWLLVTLPTVLLGALITILPSLVLLPTGNDSVFLSQQGLVGGFLGWWVTRQDRTRDHFVHSRRKAPFSRLLSSLLLGILLGTTLGLGFSPTNMYDWWWGWVEDGIIFACILSTVSWVLQGRLARFHSWDTSSFPQPPRRWVRLVEWGRTIVGRETIWTVLLLGLGFGLSYGLSDYLNNGLNFELNNGLNYVTNNKFIGGLGFGLILGPICGLSYWFLSFLVGEQGRIIRLTERVHWTWHRLMQWSHLKVSLLIFLAVFLYVGLSQGLSNGLSQGLRQELSLRIGTGLSIGLSNGLNQGLSQGLSIGLSYWVLFGLYQGLRQEHLEEHQRRWFNQGIRRSLANTFLLSLLSAGIIAGIVVFLSQGLNNGLYEGLGIGFDNGLGIEFDPGGLSTGLNMGLSIGLNMIWLLLPSGWLVIWALTGGLTILRHYTLRLLLARSRTFPFRAQPFLDDAVTRIVLKQQWGGYVFIHRRLLDYCADTYALSTPGDVPGPHETLPGETAPSSTPFEEDAQEG